MSHGTTASVQSPSLPSLALGVTLMVLALLSVIFLLQENGFLLSESATTFLHEATHDARHALGVPCH